MNVNDLLNTCDSIAPFSSSESWDNTGLLVGDKNDDVKGILITLDCAPDTVQEAVDTGANVIISHHPIIFPSVNNVNEEFIGSIIRKLIKNDINLIVMHTNLDHQPEGVSHMIAETLGFSNTKVLIPRAGQFKKLRVNVPNEDRETLKNALAQNGVGQIGEYSDCFFEYPVKGQFKPGDKSDPHIGQKGELEYVKEHIVEGIFEEKDERRVISSLIETHSYEEPAYDILSLDNASNMGLGVKFEYNDSLDALIELIKDKTGLPIVNVVKGNDKPIHTVAIIGGSGMSEADAAFNSGADVLITGDVKYHDAYDAKLLGRNIIDAGHYLEILMVKGLRKLLQDKVSTIDIYETAVNTNPFLDK
jgi:dinuclear metal center YbgI/SA1388 family protein